MNIIVIFCACSVLSLFLSSSLFSHRQISGFKQMIGTKKRTESGIGANVQEEGWEWKHIRVARGRCRCVFEENVLSVFMFSSQSYFKRRELSGRVWCLLTHQHNTPATGRDERRGTWRENRERKWQAEKDLSLLLVTFVRVFQPYSCMSFSFFLSLHRFLSLHLPCMSVSLFGNSLCCILGVRGQNSDTSIKKGSVWKNLTD